MPEVAASNRNLNRRIGIAVKVLRETKGITQKDLAASAGVTQSMISLIETGQVNSRININALEDIAITLGMGKLSKLISFAEDVPDPDTVFNQVQRFAEQYVR